VDLKEGFEGRRAEKPREREPERLEVPCLHHLWIDWQIRNEFWISWKDGRLWG
jgi:hypothetical protein